MDRTLPPITRGFRFYHGVTGTMSESPITTHPVRSTQIEHNDDSMDVWIIVGGGILGAIIIIFTIVLIVFYIRSKKKKYKTDKESLFIRKPIKIIRYSSSDNGDSPPRSLQSPTLDKDLSGCFSSLRIQPRQGSVSSLVSLQNHHGLLSVLPSDCYGTSDEEDSQAITTSGRIWFSMKYENAELNVHLVKVRYLRARGMNHELRDPFVRLYLLPDEIHYLQSKVRKRTLSPKFNESFTFKVDPEELPSRTLKLSVYDIDKRNVRHSLGHALVPLTKIDEITTQSIIWKNLDSVSQKITQLGEILVTLLCNPYKERVKLTVNRIKDLNIECLNKSKGELFVRVELFYGRKLMKVKETPLYKVTDPVEILQNFSFNVAGKYFDSCSLALTVMLTMTATKSSLGEPYGRVTVGPFMYARGDELIHWQDMIANPRTGIERWHYLSAVTQ